MFVHSSTICGFVYIHKMKTDYSRLTVQCSLCLPLYLTRTRSSPSTCFSQRPSVFSPFKLHVERRGKLYYIACLDERRIEVQFLYLRETGAIDFANLT